MTIREHLKQRVRASNIALACGIALFAGGGWLCSVTHCKWLLLFPVVGFVIVAAAAISRLFLHCPKCGGGLGLPPAYFGNPLGAEMRFCPFCGVSLDAELDATPKGYQALQPTAQTTSFFDVQRS